MYDSKKNKQIFGELVIVRKPLRNFVILCYIKIYSYIFVDRKRRNAADSLQFFSTFASSQTSQQHFKQDILEFMKKGDQQHRVWCKQKANISLIIIKITTNLKTHSYKFIPMQCCVVVGVQGSRLFLFKIYTKCYIYQVFVNLNKRVYVQIIELNIIYNKSIF